MVAAETFNIVETDRSDHFKWRRQQQHMPCPPFFYVQLISRVVTDEPREFQPDRVVPPAHVGFCFFYCYYRPNTPVAAEPADMSGKVRNVQNQQRSANCRYFIHVKTSHYVNKADCGDRHRAGTGSAVQGWCVF